MSLVLFDGSQPSVKALEAGAAPGLFGNHAKQQLVVVHATRPKILGAAAAAGSNITSFANNEIGGSGSLDHDAGDVNASSSSLKNNQGDNNNLNSNNINNNNNNTAAASIASITSVIPMVSDLINKNRYAAPSLNYKVETFRLFQGLPVSVQQERQREQELLQQLQLQTGGAGGAGGAGNNKSMKQTLQQQQAAVAAAAVLLQQQQKEKQDQQQQQQLLNRSADGDQEPGKLTDPHSLQANFADSVAARAQHHNLRTVLLGVGSSGGHGKSLTIGSFARAVIEKLRGNAKVCDVVGIFKPSGPPVRANQPMRIALVVTPNTTFDDVKSKMLSKISCLSQTRGDYVSMFVIMNDGKAKPVSLTNAMKEIEQTRLQQTALGQQNITPIPTSEEQLGLINFEQDSTPETNWKQIVEKVKNLAKQVSSLGFLNQEEKIRRENNNNNHHDESGGDEQHHQEEDQQEKAPSVVGGITTTNTIAATTVAGAAAGFEGPNLLNCFWIEPTNRDPAPSLDSNTGCIQFSKAVGGLKIDYAVLAGSLQVSGVGQAPTNSLLSANRPHVLLV